MQTLPRIGLVGPGLEILGGQGIQARALMERLSKDGYQVVFIPINPSFPPGLRWARRLPYIRTLFNQLFFFPTLLKLRHVDVAHIFCASYWSFLLAPMPAIVTARSFRKRIILNYRSGEADDHLGRWGVLVHPWLRLVDEIIVPSEYLRGVFKKHGYNVRVIRNVVDLSRYRYRERDNLRPRLLSNRNLEPYYNVSCILRAFALVKERYPDAALVVAGYGSQEQLLRDLAASLKVDGIDFLGRVEPEAMPALYDHADIYVNASILDNQPVSLLEAFAAGTPVVSTGVGDISYMITHGETGLIIPQHDPDAMAKAVISLLENPLYAVSIARRAKQEVERFTWPHVRKEWAAAYTGKVA